MPMRKSYVPVLQIGPEAVFIRHHLFSTFRHMPLIRCDHTREKMLIAQWQGMNFKERLPYILASKMKSRTSIRALDKLTSSQLTKKCKSLEKAGGLTSANFVKSNNMVDEKAGKFGKDVSGYKAFVRAQLIILSLSRRGEETEGYDLSNLWSHLEFAKRDIKKEFLKMEKGRTSLQLKDDSSDYLRLGDPSAKSNGDDPTSMSSTNFMSFINTANKAKSHLSLNCSSTLKDHHKKIRSKWKRMSAEDRLSW
ncbi:purine nucleoside phosphorylase [Perkinsela sp. CCAP 1560/4]|nr:purine nucleoside phosphorylase [Perkinsela sp. CCAP 1560/4]|eukprot:KNH09558.1 purine nucleoside phosphorylase [Perkinsela sp. CCAP 1560/4]